MKKTVSFLLSILIVFISLGVPLSALADDGSGRYTVNPFYSGASAERPALASEITKASVEKRYDGKTYYTEGKQLFSLIKNNFELRKKNFKIRVLSRREVGGILAKLEFFESLFQNATEDELSSTSTDGDYIRWAVSGLEYNSFTKDTKKDGYYYYTIDAVFSYYDSLAEERLVEKEINTFISSLNRNKLSDYEVIKRVHDYICSKTVYCNAAMETPELYDYAFTAYGALIKGSCVCQGYSVAFYRICRELGFNCRFVSSNPRRGCHAWNLIELDGKYYYIDLTWDDQITDEGLAEKNDSSVKEYEYFLVNYEHLKKHDTVYYEHTLDSNYYDTTEFYANYGSKIDKEDYKRDNSSRFSKFTVALERSVYSGAGSYKPAVTLRDTEGNVLVNNKDYTLTYSGINAVGSGFATVKGKGDYAGEITRRKITVNPKSTPSLSLKSKGREADSLTLKWKASSENISGYLLEIYKNGKWRELARLGKSASSYRIEKLTPSSAYRFRLRAFKHDKYGISWAPYSSKYINATKPQKVKVKSVTAGKGSIKISFKKTKADGYELSYSKKSNMKGAKTVKVKKSAVSKTVKKLKRNKKYYVRIRAYKKYTDYSGRTKTVYGKWSTKKSIISR